MQAGTGTLGAVPRLVTASSIAPPAALPRLTSATWMVEMRIFFLRSSLGLSVQTNSTIRKNYLCRTRVVHMYKH